MEPWTSNALTPEQFRDEMVAWCNILADNYDIKDKSLNVEERYYYVGRHRGACDILDHLRAATFHPIPPDGAHN